MTATSDFIFVLDKNNREMMVQFDEKFERLVFTDDNETVWMVTGDVSAEHLSVSFDPGTIQTIQMFAGTDSLI